jgi:hypothetical protein
MTRQKTRHTCLATGRDFQAVKRESGRMASPGTTTSLYCRAVRFHASRDYTILIMKKILLIILTSSILSCNQSKVTTQLINNEDFYSALNELIKLEYPNAKMIIGETVPVYKNTYDYFPEQDIKENEPPPPPPPPPPGIVYYNKSTFSFFISRYNLGSTDATFMYQSIDSTKRILIDSLNVNLKVIERKKVQEIFSQKTELFSDKWKLFRETFGEGCFIEISTPIFNSTFTKLIITIKKLCGPPDGEDSTFILEKIKDKWKVVEGKYDITTDPKEKSTKT